METINRSPIIARFDFAPRPLTRGGRIVIVDRGASRGTDNYRYVASVHFGTDGNYDKDWALGRYYNTLEEAYYRFLQLVERYVGLPGMAPVANPVRADA